MATRGTVRLSVDLGTTWTAAAVSEGGVAEPLMLGSAGPSMPSVVAVVDGEVIAGGAAVRAGASNPASAAREFKRRLGDTAPIVLAGTPYGAETLMGHLLAHVVRIASEQFGVPELVTLTHPAVFGEYKLDLMREAARVAGLGSVGLRSEPEAAALHYAHVGRLRTGDTVAVYDFGGGTFDAAVVRLDPDGPTLLGRPEGLERLGGIDLDHAVLAHVDASLDGALAQLDTANPDVRRAVSALREQCVQAKEALSADTEVSVAVTVPGLDTVVRITRTEFESFVRPRLSETLGALDRAIASAGLTAGDLAGVVLVGGSSRIPVVVEQVGAHLGRPLLLDADPKLVVALGANATLNRQTTAPEEIVMATTTPPAAGEPAGRKTDESTATVSPGPGGPASTGGGAGQGVAQERRTAPSKREPEKGGMSTAGKVAAGAAAVGLAGATAAFWRDDIEEAIGLGDDDAPEEALLATPDDLAAAIADVDARDAAAALDAAAAAEALAAQAAPVEESMDAFDAVAESPPAAEPQARFVSQGGAGPVRQQARADVAEGRPVAQTAPPAAPTSPAPPAPPAPAATPTPPAPANVTSTAPPVPGPSADTNPAFEAAREQLQQRLAAWQPPEGADPAEVAELRARLDGLLERYEPRPDQSVDEAVADLRDQFELRIDNFTQDEKIDALVEELSDLRDEVGLPGAPDPEFESRRDALRASLDSWTAPEGTSAADAADLKAQLQSLVDGYQPPPGSSAEDAMAALQAQFRDQLQDFTQDQKIDALFEAQAAEDGDAPTVAADAAPGRGSVQTQVLVDDFDEMVGAPTATMPRTPSAADVDAGPRPGMAADEPSLGRPRGTAVVDGDLTDDEDMFSLPKMDGPAAGDVRAPSNTGVVPPRITLDDDDTFAVGDLIKPRDAEATADADADVSPITDPADDLPSVGDLDVPDLDDDLSGPGGRSPLATTTADLVSDDDHFGTASDFGRHDDLVDLDVDAFGASDLDDPMRGT